MQKAWYIGNTTLRNPQRLKEGLRVLVNSPFHGNLEGRENEQEFARLLHQEGVMFIKRIDDPGVDFSDSGRKWRAALMQLGFIKPSFADKPFTVTPNGQRLLEARSLPAEQECFLRALLAQQIPSQIEKFPEPVFSPLRIFLEVLSGLEKAGLDAHVTQNEMACIVQLVRKIDDVDEAIHKIQQYREKEIESGNRNKFANEVREATAFYTHRQSESTLYDYADTNFRYLKLTGLFVENGRGVSRRLSVVEYKKVLVEQIVSEPYEPIPEDEYLNVLWNGASLPTDNDSEAIEAIRSLVSLFEEHGVEVTVPNIHGMSTEDLTTLKLDLEDQWLKVLEDKYAQRQKYEWENIVQYLRALNQSGRRSKLIPQGEAPAYLEWVLWRSFLAINSMVNKPWEARRFNIDQDFYPRGTAPGGGPDMIIEFDEFVIAVEVTLTSSSRQEAAEGEPVRRHVADLVDFYEEKGKRVYGLFIANNIDTNTAETFRIGVWYRKDDSRLAVDIVPLTLKQFTDIFEVGFRKNSELDYRLIEQLIRECLVESRAEAPEWKKRIDQQVSKFISEIQG